MRARTLRDRRLLAVGCVLAAVLGAGALWALAAAAPQAKKKATPAEKGAAKTEEEKKDTGAAAKTESSDTALFTSFRKAGGSGEQRTTTAAANVKGVDASGKPTGHNIATSSPDSTARSRVATMEAAKPTPAELAAFIKDGKLKGGSQ